MNQKMTVHKRNAKVKDPLVSVILSDWSVRDKFQALDWLNRQDAPRDEYELIWVELYDRVSPEAMAHADVVITCSQKGVYSKHNGHNIGYLHARGQIVTVCDSDAVFPPDFICSIRKSFSRNSSGELKSLVLMHDEYRNNSIPYPDGILTIEKVRSYPWLPLWKNAGACNSVLKADAIRLGGWDEHRSFRGPACGGDLLWRLINAGVPQKWHDDSVALYHFAHPHPEVFEVFSFSVKMWRELVTPYVHGAAYVAVESFATGRLLPLKENHEVHRARMSLRTIGSEAESAIGNLPISVTGFTRMQKARMYLKFYRYKLALLVKFGWR